MLAPVWPGLTPVPDPPNCGALRKLCDFWRSLFPFVKCENNNNNSPVELLKGVSELYMQSA